MTIFDRKPVLRWLTPLAVVLVVGAGSVVAATANADPRLDSISAQDLLVRVQTANVDAMSGTVVETADLGFPKLPGLAGSDDASLSSLISGSHTMKVWFSGPDKARLQIQAPLKETDVIKDGSDLWTWSYQDKTATHRTLSAQDAKTSAAKKPAQLPADLPKTPQDAAKQILDALSPTTNVSVDGTSTVAGRPVYELVLSPKDANSQTLIGQIRIAVDSVTSIPLRVEVLTQKNEQAFDVEFSSVDFARPDNGQFVFNPPAGTKVTQEAAPKKDATPKKTESGKKATANGIRSAAQPEVVGKGWETVVITKLPTSSADATSGQLGSILSALPTTSGSWGSGHVLEGSVFTAVLTDDGRLAVGAVPAKLVFDALSK